MPDLHKYEFDKKEKRKLRFRKIHFFMISVLGMNKIRWLKKKDIFGLLGNDVLYQPKYLPNNAKRIRIHNNVRVAADVIFYEHDVINSVFAKMDNLPYCGYGSCIEIYDNVFIGGRSVLVGNVSIGPNAIVAAGSVVVKDVKPGTIVGGNPAKVIGSFDDLHIKRKVYCDKKITDEQLWKLFYAERSGEPERLID